MQQGNIEDSSKRIVTNRNKLTRLFHFINTISDDIALVTVDIVFPDGTKEDSALASEMQKLQHSNKLVIAYNNRIAAQNPYLYKQQLDPSVFGDVTKVSNESFYFSHSLQTEEGIPSMPYAMYLKLNKPGNITHSMFFAREGKKILFRNFITEFNFTNEYELYKDPYTSNPTNSAVKVSADTALQQVQAGSFYTLGRSISEDGQQEIIDRLGTLKNGKKAIIFISNINDEYVDHHSTPYGMLCGATILLNEFYYISKGYHVMSLLTFFLFYLPVLFIGFYWISLWMLWRASIDDKRPGANDETITDTSKQVILALSAPTKQQQSLKNKNSFFRKSMSFIKQFFLMIRKPFIFLPHFIHQKINQFISWIESSKKMSFLSSMYIFLIDEFHYFWLFAFVFFVDVFFHKLINVMGLLYIFWSFSALMKFHIQWHIKNAAIMKVKIDKLREDI